jgi:hypothetical protein
VRAVAGNLRGGRSRNVGALLTALAMPSPRKAPWWRRALALDSGSVVQIAGNAAIALVLGVLVAMILYATVRSFGATGR